jgi:hypothetical protein
MRTGVRNERFEVSAEYSTLTFFVESKTAVVYGKATGLAGYVEAAWNPDGSMNPNSDPTIHLEFPVENVRSGNDLRDREMWKLIDSKRFPTIAADLLSIRPSANATTHAATGRITLAGIAHTYEGMFDVDRDGGHVTVSGFLDVDVRQFGLKERTIRHLSVEPVVKVHLHMVAIAGSG